MTMPPMLDPSQSQYARKRRDLIVAGGRPGAPAGVDGEALECDRELVAAMKCPNCGLRKRVRYVPFTDPAGEYVALAVCEACYWCGEF